METVTYHWEKTSQKRLNDIQAGKCSLSDVFAKYAILKQPDAYPLIQLDFKTLNLTKADLDLESWKCFMKNILLVTKINIKDETAKSLIKLIEKPELQTGKCV